MKLAILGANKHFMPLYEKAHEMGIETYCVAWDKDAYCKDFADHYVDISIIDQEAVAQFCREEKIDGIVSNALERAVPTLAYVHEQCGVNGNSMRTAMLTTNKMKMRLKVEESHACPQPRFKICAEIPTIEAFPVVIKPIDGTGSCAVTKVDSKDELKPAIDRVKEYSKSNQWLVEEYIEGHEVSVESISFHSQHYILAITDKITTGAPYFVEIGHHQPSSLPQEIQSRLKRYTLRLLETLEINNSASHAEFKITNDGKILLMEIASRGGGGWISSKLVELSTGYDYMKGIIQVALGHFEPPKKTRSMCSGVYFLSCDTSYIKDYIMANKAAQWMIHYDIEDRDGQKLESAYDRTGYFIYQSGKRIIPLLSLLDFDIFSPTASDLNEILRCLGGSSDLPFKPASKQGKEWVGKLSQHAMTLRCKSKERIVGSIFFYCNDFETGNATVVFFCVHPSYRNQGIGKKMISTLKEYLSTLPHINQITLSCKKGNQPALKMYSACGFKPADELPESIMMVSKTRD